MVQKLIANKEETLSCSESIIITDYETGEMFCQSCGRILQEKITDARNESGLFTQNQHMHTSLTMHDMGLSTIIGKSNHDFVGKPLGYEMKKSMKRMRVWDSQSQVKTTAERNLRSAFYKILKLKEKLALSDAVIERAAYFYRKDAKARLVRGRSIKSIVGACMYAACRDKNWGFCNNAL